MANVYYRGRSGVSRSVAQSANLTVASLSWTRSGTTVTLTWTGHGLVTKNDVIITASGTGFPNDTYRVQTIPNGNTLTFTVPNAGTTSGTCTAANKLWYDADDAGNNVGIPDENDNVIVIAGYATLTNDDQAFTDVTVLSVDDARYSVGVYSTENLGDLLVDGGRYDPGNTTGAGILWQNVEFRTGTHAPYGVESKMRVNGNIKWADSGFAWITNNRGYLRLIGNGTIQGWNTSCLWSLLIIDAGVTTTLAGNTLFSKEGDSNRAHQILGVLAIGQYRFQIGDGGLSGSLTIGENADITGSGELRLSFRNADFCTISKADAISFTGNVMIDPIASSSRYLPSGDWRNSTFYFNGEEINAPKLILQDGVLRVKNFYIKKEDTQVFYLDASDRTDDIYVYSNLDFGYDDSLKQVTYSCGDFTWRLLSTDPAVCNFDGLGLCKVSIEESADYTAQDSFILNSLNVDGTLTLDPEKSYTIQADVTGSGTMQSSSEEIVYMGFTGEYEFDGTLDNVVFFKNGNGHRSHALNLGLGITL